MGPFLPCRALCRVSALILLLCAALWLLGRPLAASQTVTVAVASNFLSPLEALAERFTGQTGYTVRISSGSTGKLFAQILRGAPYDVFLSADEARPARLEAEGQGVRGSRFPYAFGRLVLWRPQHPVKEVAGPKMVYQVRSLAMANPALAPYGRAARQTYERLGFQGALSARIVFGENVGQTFALIASGNAEAGFVALSQIQSVGAGGGLWIVPTDLHDPIRQDAVLLARGAEAVPARAFLDFLRADAARALIAEAGYGVPGPAP